MAAAVLIALLACVVVSGAAAAGPSASLPLADRLRQAAPLFTLQAGAEEGGGQQQQKQGWLMECWGAVAELRACTDEMVLFFLNGESYLGRPCCLAIRTVTAHCWPAMLDAVGFTAREADVLRGFCHAEVQHGYSPPPLPPSSPAPAPAAQA